MHNEKFNVDLYIRVSTDRQAKEGDSLEEQEKELKKFCEYRQFQIRHIYIERGKSGGNTNRPEYKKLVKDVATGKVDAVVVKKLDRLSRSLLDFEQFILLLQKHTVEFISLKENFDTTFAMGKAMFRVALVFAQLEREQTSERVVDVMAFRASQGQFNGGVPPFGYTNSNKELIPYPKEKQIVELLFERFIETKSTTQTAKFLNETGYQYRNGKLWTKQTVQRLLHNPIYTGKLFWKGELHQGLHAPIISEKRFHMVDTIFKTNRRVLTESKTKALLQKLIYCGHCKTAMTPGHALNHQKQKYYYYRCLNTQHSEKGKHKCLVRYLAFKTTEQTILNILLSLSEEGAFRLIENKILKHNQGVERKAKHIRDKIKELETKHEDLKVKKDKYFDSLITGSFSSLEREKINKRIEEMELEEKHFKSELYKQQFELTQFLDDKINLTQMTQVFIAFKAGYDSFSWEQIREYLVSHIEKIFFYSDYLEINFKLLPFPISFKR